MLLSSIKEVKKRFKSPTQKLLMLVAQGSDFKHSALKDIPGEVYGAIFPQIICDKFYHNDKIIVINLNNDVHVSLCKFDNFNKQKIDKTVKDIVLFLDGLSNKIDNFLEKLYEVTSVKTTIIGACAGKISLKQEEVIFDKHKIIYDGVLILANSWNMSISAKHGLKKIGGPFIASNLEDKKLYSLDYKDAFEVYKKVVEKDAKIKFDEYNFFDIAKSYPLGILKINGEILVKDIISKEQNSLELINNIDKNSLVYILKGEKKHLIESAKEATLEAIHNKKDLDGIFIVNCISRLLFLEKDFSKELNSIKNAVGKKDFTMFGVLSLGEIANDNRDYIELYTKTCVIGAY